MPFWFLFEVYILLIFPVSIPQESPITINPPYLSFYADFKVLNNCLTFPLRSSKLPLFSII
jgi:hypothetical protein